MTNLLPIGTRVTHFDGGKNTHGKGTIVSYNEVKVSEYLNDEFDEAINIAAKTGTLQGIVASFYSFDRCPYVVKWDNGYQDVYEKESINKL